MADWVGRHMASQRNRETMIRLWGLVMLLARRRRGLTITQLVELTETSRATIYRYLAVLREAGVPLESHTVSGEVRHSLWGTELPPLGPTPLQIAALRLARRALGGLEGTAATREIDKLLDGYSRALGALAPLASITLAKARHVPPDMVSKLDRAIATQRRTRIRYRSVEARAPGWRTVDPLGLRYAKGQLYFVAYDDKRSDFVPFKLDRVTAVDILRTGANRHPGFDPQRLFEHSATAWTGEGVDVVVRLSSVVARFAGEYPIVVNQTLTDEKDGSVRVHARVASVTEAMRWVLGWGKEAEALQPPELRQAVAEQVRGASLQYDVPAPGKRRIGS